MKLLPFPLSGKKKKQLPFREHIHNNETLPKPSQWYLVVKLDFEGQALAAHWR
jgi:hypothetical protein